MSVYMPKSSRYRKEQNICTMTLTADLESHGAILSSTSSTDQVCYITKSTRYDKQFARYTDTNAKNYNLNP